MLYKSASGKGPSVVIPTAMTEEERKRLEGKTFCLIVNILNK